MEFNADSVLALITVYGLRIIGALVMLGLGWYAAKIARRFTHKALSKINNFDKTLTHFISSLVRYAILAFTVVAVLNNIGVQTASLIAVMGAAGLAVGLALQGTLSHVASGVMLLIFRPFKIGDFIDVGGNAGTAQEISLFTTTLATPDNVKVIVPNGQVWDQALKNYSAYDTRRIQLTVGIAYDADIDTAMKAITKTVTADKRVLKDPAPMVAVSNLGESSVDLIVRVWTKSSDFWPTTFDLTKAVKQDLDAAGIEIPFPQRVLHLNDAAAAALKGKKAA